MLDHISLKVTDVERSKRFYQEALKPLGYELVMEFPGMAGFGVNHRTDFWLSTADKVVPTHVAYSSPDRKTVGAFHKAAVAAGGKDNGAPGLRPHYHANYYGAFVFDPDGNNIEAVTHKPE